jgi:DNA-binding response OmpR family regulator
MTKVMLIEDDAIMLSLLINLLEFEGFDVSQLGKDADLENVVNSIRADSPDLLLVDVHLGNFSGFDLLDRIRQDGLPNSPKVLMTSGMELSHQCYEAGADGFILKPYMPDDLVGKIRNILGS